ncbi:MAG: energy transducer TonB [Gammaproteobacteria bacterium]|nr:energy transducer TonB [Gammaproteobacteria bacterium]
MVAIPKAAVPCSRHGVSLGECRIYLARNNAAVKILGWPLLLLLAGCLGSYNRPIQLVSFVGPSYPETARLQKVEGTVIVRYDVTVEGVVHNVRVASAEPPGVFDDAALAAVRRWRYNAPILDGERQPVRNMESRVTFVLGNTEQYDEYE